MKKFILPIVILIILTLVLAFTLIGNKKKIDQANKPVDRSQVPVSVTIAAAEIHGLDVNKKYPAIIVPYEQANVSSQTSGMLSALNIQLGQKVTKGQIIGKIDTRILEINLKSALINLKSAEIKRDKLLDDYNRAKDLYENKAGLEVSMLTAKSDFEGAANSYENTSVQIGLIRQQIENSTIYAPLTGIVSAKNSKQGEFVTQGVPIATITNITSLKATVFVDQQIAYQLRQAQIASITSPVFSGKQFEGKIIFISPVADANHNYQIDLLVANNDGVALKGGTDVQISFNTLSRKNALVIPKQALMTDAQQPYVYVVEGGTAKVKIITTGLVQNDQVEVLSGLKTGQAVVTGGQINLRDGSSISIINK